MGEIADNIINGDFDMYTGEYIGKGLGFPRTIEFSRIKNIYRFKKTRKPSLYGLRKFMSRFSWIKNTQQANDLILEYAKSIDIRGDLLSISQKIQNDFKSFKQFIESYNNKL